ncbi:unnamed protein product [Rotaria sp. Silwood1]|nr:unnamed protein product [Rotaria sp. Silwood1]
MNSICIGIILIFLLVSTQSYTLPPSSTESPNNNDCVGTDCLSTESGEQVPVVELTTTGNTKDAYLCECSQESHETSRDKADDSSDECTNICTTALEMNQFQGELSKLIGVALIFQHHYRKLREILSPASLDSVAKDLNTSNLRKQVFNGVWPLVTDVRVENALDRLILEQGFQLSNKHNIQNLGTARLHIREQLTKLQNNQIKKIAEAISTAFNISVHAISSTAIDTYLRNASADAENALLNEIVSGYS